jgi:hypothetical protein
MVVIVVIWWKVLIVDIMFIVGDMSQRHILRLDPVPFVFGHSTWSPWKQTMRFLRRAD